MVDPDTLRSFCMNEVTYLSPALTPTFYGVNMPFSFDNFIIFGLAFLVSTLKLETNESSRLEVY
jgi:hypothetical protein